MAKKGMQKVLSQADMMNLLDSLYSKCIQGIPMTSSPIEKMADDYLQHNATVEDAAKDMINKQVIKCTTSGFITNLGGVITLPVTIPIYVQAKKKTGKDTGDIVGVDQLVKMEEQIPEKNAILMVINLTDEFSDKAKEKADENGIILINGLTFASLLVRYGIEVDIR